MLTEEGLSRGPLESAAPGRGGGPTAEKKNMILMVLVNKQVLILVLQYVQLQAVGSFSFSSFFPFPLPSCLSSGLPPPPLSLTVPPLPPYTPRVPQRDSLSLFGAYRALL